MLIERYDLLVIAAAILFDNRGGELNTVHAAQSAVRSASILMDEIDATYSAARTARRDGPAVTSACKRCGHIHVGACMFLNNGEPCLCEGEQ